MKTTIFYPSNIDFEGLLKKYDLSPTRKKNLLLKLIRTVSVLYPTPYNRRGFDENGCRYISYRFKKKVLTRDYSLVMGILTSGNDPIIKSNNSYEVGVNSKKYSLEKKYRYSKSNSLEITRDVSKHSFYLDSQFNVHSLSIDPQIENYLASLYHEVCSLGITKNEITLLKNYIGRNVQVINDFNNGILFYNRSKSNNRYNTSITILSKIIRPFLRVNNEMLVSIDIKASQPYVLASILDIDFYINTNSLYNINKIGGVGGGILFPQFLRNKERDIKAFRSIPFYKDFYSHILENEFKRPPTPEERERMKHKTMQFLFFNNSIARKKKELGFLQNQFPLIDKFITQCLNVIGPRSFAHLLQRSESYLLLDVIAKDFHSTYPTAPLYTIHDSILTTVKNAGALHEFMDIRLFDLTGIKAGFSVEYLKRSTIPNGDDVRRIHKKISSQSRNHNSFIRSIEFKESYVELANTLIKKCTPECSSPIINKN